jgi:hypothetical protein
VKFQDLSGQKFGRWLVTSIFERRISPCGHSHIIWKVICSCPAKTEKFVKACSLKNGGSQSCGCLHQELRYKTRLRDDMRVKDHPLYPKWLGIRQRCYNPHNPSYRRYGGKRTDACPEGVKLSDRWRFDFWAFVEDVSPRPSLAHELHRRDNDKGLRS